MVVRTVRPVEPIRLEGAAIEVVYHVLETQAEVGVVVLALKNDVVDSGHEWYCVTKHFFALCGRDRWCLNWDLWLRPCYYFFRLWRFLLYEASQLWVLDFVFLVKLFKILSNDLPIFHKVLRAVEANKRVVQEVPLLR